MCFLASRIAGLDPPPPGGRKEGPVPSARLISLRGPSRTPCLVNGSGHLTGKSSISKFVKHILFALVCCEDVCRGSLSGPRGTFLF
jgi:hypothetical protein